MLVFTNFFTVNAHHAQTGQVDTTTDNLLELEHHTAFKNWADDLWKLATAMGINRVFFQGRQRRHFAYPFHVAEDAIQMDSHKTLHPCHTQFFKVFWGTDTVSQIFVSKMQ